MNMASPTAGPSDTCDCDDSMVEVIYALAATSGLFLVLTIVCGVVTIALLWRLARMSREAKQAAKDETECPYWEDTPVPTLEETLSSQTKINTLGLGTADSFCHQNSGHRAPIMAIRPGGRKKIRPKRSAPPPPKGGKQVVDSEEEGYTSPHRYVPQPGSLAHNQHLPHEYRQLDMVTVEADRAYTQLVRGGSLPPMNLHSTTFESS